MKYGNIIIPKLRI